MGSRLAGAHVSVEDSMPAEGSPSVPLFGRGIRTLHCPATRSGAIECGSLAT